VETCRLLHSSLKEVRDRLKSFRIRLCSMRHVQRSVMQCGLGEGRMEVSEWEQMLDVAVKQCL
jgi:hypothetical protein